VIEARFEYWMTILLLLIGFYGLLAKHNLVKKVIGLNIVQSATILFFLSMSLKTGGTVPILPHHGAPELHVYISPLPHVLMLTAIVVMVSTSGVAFALLIRIHRRYGTLDERAILGRGLG
jgi:multicomponent Na+:H+ antiporter subunit C